MVVDEREIQGAIDTMLKLGKSLKKIRGGSFPTDLLSAYGELRVYLELKRLFPHVVDLSFKGKARADISLGSINIEVKTSNYKEEEYGEGYGFAIHVKKCRKHPYACVQHPRRKKINGDLCYLDYLICVAANEENLGKPTFYVFSRNELDSLSSQIMNKSKRFWYPPYRILLPVKPDTKMKGELYGDFDLKLARDRKRFRDRWDKINEDPRSLAITEP